MTHEQNPYSLLEQLNWIKQQDMLLAKIEGKLLAMKDLAVYRLNHKVTASQIKQLNHQMAMLQQEMQQLQQELSIKDLLN